MYAYLSMSCISTIGIFFIIECWLRKQILLKSLSENSDQAVFMSVQGLSLLHYLYTSLWFNSANLSSSC